MSDRLPMNPCDEREDWLEPFVDGDLEAAEAARYQSHLDSCDACRDEYDFAVAVQRSLRDLPELDTPPQVIARILETAQQRPWHERLLERLSPGLPAPVWSALAAALVLVVLAYGIPRSSQPPAPETDPQVARATEEARIALAWVGGLTRRTAHDLRTEVLVGRVVDPTRRALGTSPKAQETSPRSDQGAPLNDSPSSERSG